uniref:Phosphohydrolase n=1 Tax=Ammonifex degensii TaxID=42838 RepID=A0A7C2I1L2_9THEO
MSLWKCPGQDRRDFGPEDVILAPCPSCGAEVEFFPDDIMVRCRCGRLVRNPKFNPACAAWCAHADKCLGEVAEVYRRQPEVLREKLLLEVNRRLREFPAERQAALAAASFAAELSKEEGGSPLVVTAAVLLKEIGLAAGATGEALPRASVALAREVMAEIGLPSEVIEEVAAIIAALPTGVSGRLNERLARDALRLAGWSGEIKGKSEEEIEMLAATFYTAAGRERALLASKRFGRGQK